MIETRPDLREEFLALIGDIDLMAEEMDAFSRSVCKFNETEEELTREYPEQWVAYKNGEVIAASIHIDEVLRCVDAIGLGARHGMMLRFLTDDPMPTFLDRLEFLLSRAS